MGRLLKIRGADGKWLEVPAIKGSTGATFTPNVSNEGVLSWENDKGLKNPDPISIKGPIGSEGATFTPHLSETGDLSWTNNKGLPNPDPVNIMGKVSTDTTLTVEGTPADAKATGDKIIDVELGSTLGVKNLRTEFNKSLRDLDEAKQPKGNYLTSESDPTVPSWAKEETKPKYTANEVGALSKDGTAKDSSKLGGQLPSYYAKSEALSQLNGDINGEIDLADWERGFVSTSGEEISNNYTWRTGKIQVSPLAPYKIVVVNHNGYVIRKFNASDEVIGSVSQTGSASTEKIEKSIWLNDEGISYIRMCVTSQDNTNYPANGENVSLFLSVNEQYCRNYGEVTPEMFGAVGDGVTNDTTALQACIDYAALNGVSVKSVKGRKYKITQITINKPVDIDLGWATIVSGSASSTVIVNRTTNAAYGNTRVNGTLRRVIFDGNLVSNGILYISNDVRGVYEDLIIQNMGEKVSSSGRTDEDKGTENLSRGIVYAAQPGKGGGNYFRNIYGQMQPNYGSYDTLLIDVLGSDSTFQNIDYQHIKYGIRITGGAFVDNFHGYVTGSSIYPGSYCMRVGKNGFVIASQYYPDTQQYGTIVNNDGKPVIINGGMSYFSPNSEIATSGAVLQFPPYLFYGANSDQLKGVNVCGMYFNAPAGDNGEPYTYTLCNVDTQLKIINSVYNNIIGAPA